MARKRIGEMLVDAGLLTADGLRRALVEQKRWGGQLGAILIDLKLVAEDALVSALASQLNFPTVDVSSIEPADEVLALVPTELAERHRIVPFKREGKFLDVATSDPTNLGIIDELQIRTQLNVRTHLAGPKSVDTALARLYGINPSNVGMSFQPRDVTDSMGGFFLQEEGETADLQAGPEDAGAVGAKLPRPNFDAARAEHREREILALQERISALESLVDRDENVIRKLLGLLVDKGIATREEILERISD
ncbi:MAG: hypothetical protein KJO07_07385 [Deltaproteobacteria bacterium]|nr:hypothetical protein [Deltaproteobacteria bacterium]